jgi:hypothetical protein
MDGFQEALEDYQLGDLGYLGPRFACSNRRQYGSFTKERLDRVVANLEWWSQFLVVSIHILAAKTSNHNPIFVEFFEQPAKPHFYKRSFKFEASWTTDEEWKDVVQSAWENCLPERILCRMFKPICPSVNKLFQGGVGGNLGTELSNQNERLSNLLNSKNKKIWQCLQKSKGYKEKSMTYLRGRIFDGNKELSIIGIQRGIAIPNISTIWLIT